MSALNQYERNKASFDLAKKDERSSTMTGFYRKLASTRIRKPPERTATLRTIEVESIDQCAAYPNSELRSPVANREQHSKGFIVLDMVDD